MKYLSILPIILLVACTKELPPEPFKVEPVKDATEQSAIPADHVETGTVVTDQEQK